MRDVSFGAGDFDGVAYVRRHLGYDRMAASGKKAFIINSKNRALPQQHALVFRALLRPLVPSWVPEAFVITGLPTSQMRDVMLSSSRRGG